jgi:hypothetical protein
MKTTKKTARAVAAPVSIAVRHAFLGRRILSELRILMRLAMSPSNAVTRSGRFLERDLVSY